MVLPDRIELSTSPLPMECSTTELRQHARYSGNWPKRPPTRRPVLATRAPLAQARGRVRKGPKIGKNRRWVTGEPVQSGQLRADPVPDSPLAAESWPKLLCRTRMVAYGRRQPPDIGDCSPARRNPLCSGKAARRRRQILFRSRACSDGLDDEGRSRQGRRKDRRGCEGFTTGPAEAGVARKSQAAKVAGAGAQRCRAHLPKTPTPP